MSKQKLWELPEPSSASVSGFVRLSFEGRDLMLEFDFDRDGIALMTGLKFESVRAFRHRQEIYETEWHISEVFDTLVEVSPSEWVLELQSAASPDQKSEWTMRHFMITFDSAGCYEIVAKDWWVLPEANGSLRQTRA